VLLALVAAAPAGAVTAGEPASAEVDAYLEVVPDAGGGHPSERVPIESIAPAADTEHCVQGAHEGAGAAVAGFLGVDGPSGGAGQGPLLLVAVVLVSIAFAAVALARRRRGAALTTLCIGLLLLPAVAVAATAEDPGLRLGIVAGREGTSTLSAAEFQRMRLGGADSVRAALEWELAQPEKGGPLDFSHFDQLMRWASQGPLPRVTVLPILFASPAWVKGIKTSNEPPATRSDLKAWQAFVRAAVARYGPEGGFWAENRGEIASGRLRYNPITDWQVWNEPNLSPFWSNARPDPEGYARLLELTDDAVKAEDPHARTVLAGMLERLDAPRPMSEFLADLYKVKGISGHFDVLAPQPFAFVGEAKTVRTSIERIRRLADAHGDSDKPIFVTEVGVATGGPKTDLTTDEAGQAASVREFLSQAQKLAAKDDVEAIYWFQWRDADVDPPTDPDRNRWQTYTGLFTYDGQPKQSWQAFCAAARGSLGSGPLP
jgi:hypothetical protein